MDMETEDIAEGEDTRLLTLASVEDLDVSEASIDALRGRAWDRFSDGIETGALQRAMQEALGHPITDSCSGNCPHALQVEALTAEVERLRLENEALRKENANLQGRACNGATGSATCASNTCAGSAGSTSIAGNTDGLATSGAAPTSGCNGIAASPMIASSGAKAEPVAGNASAAGSAMNAIREVSKGSVR